MSAITTFWKRLSGGKPVQERPQPPSVAEVGKALGILILVASHNRTLTADDVMPAHLLGMRRYNVTPLQFAARLCHASEGELMSAAMDFIRQEALENTGLHAFGWTFPNVEEGYQAITTLTWGRARKRA